MRYSPAEVDDCAERLYALAAAIIRAAVASGIIGGAILGGLLGAAAGHGRGGGAVLGALVGATIGGFLGYELGRTRSLHLRLEAQNALCFRDIRHAVVPPEATEAVPPDGAGPAVAAPDPEVASHLIYTHFHM